MNGRDSRELSKLGDEAIYDEADGHARHDKRPSIKERKCKTSGF